MARLLTDHPIPQSHEWQAATTLIKRQRFNGYLGSILHALRVAMFWWKYDVFLTANVRNAALFCFVRRIFPFGAPKIIALEFRMDDQRSTTAWRLKRTFQRFAFRGIDLICVSAREEVVAYSSRLGLEQDRFRFVPWHTNVEDPHFAPSRGNYVFAAGRTGRDWVTFAKAVRGLPVEAVAVCSAQSASSVDFPSNVKVFLDIDYGRYRDLLAGARIVVVALETHIYSSGQVAFLEAMALAKPVIVTDCVGSRDYIADGVNGLTVPPQDSQAIREAISRLLSDAELERQLQMGAIDSIKETHTLERYVKNALALANDLGGTHSAKR